VQKAIVGMLGIIQVIENACAQTLAMFVVELTHSTFRKPVIRSVKVEID